MTNALPASSRPSSLKPAVLQGLHAHKPPDLLEDDELQSRGGSEPAPDGDESPPEGGGALLGDDLGEAVEGVGVELGVCGLVHEAGSDHVEGGDGASHEEAGAAGRHGLGEDGGLGEAGLLDDETLDLVVAAHLGAVEHHRPHDVAVDATVEAPDALVAHELLGSVDDAGGLLALTGHHLGLEDVKGVAGEGAEGAGGGAGSKLLDEGGVLRGGAAEGDLAGLVKAKAETGVRTLPKPGGVDALPEGSHTLLASDGLNSSTHAEGAVVASSSGARHLEPRLHNIDGVDE
mmetsp:Transcript_6276/g.13060  ORF Transcript_6276/g.13060 Transcript_6276/m.13060 type:complete len:289 (+) Transcript_6276:271-1137(+)